MLHIKLNGKEHRWPSTYSLLTHALNLWVGLKGKQNLNVVMLHIKLMGKKYRLTLKQTL